MSTPPSAEGPAGQYAEVGVSGPDEKSMLQRLPLSLRSGERCGRHTDAVKAQSGTFVSAQGFPVARAEA